MPRSSYRRILAVVLALTALLLLVINCGTPRQSSPRAVDGFLDLTNWNFAKDGPAKLDGQWEFLWNAAPPTEHRGPLSAAGPADQYAVPALWRTPTALGRRVSPHGRAVYRLRLRLPSGSGPDALYLSNVLSACQIWVDGRRVGATGDIDDAGQETPRKHLAMPVFVPAGREVDIVLAVANHTNLQGGINASIRLGTRDQIGHFLGMRWLGGAFIAGVLLAMGAYHLILFSLRRTDKSSLYFGLFSLAWSVATLFNPASGFVMSAFTELPWKWHIDLALLPYALTIPLMVALYHALFPKKYGRFVNAGYALLGGAYAIVLLASGPSAFGRIPFFYFWVTRTAFLYLFVAFASDFLHRERGVLLLAPGYLALGYAELSKMLANLHITASAGFAPYGMPIFILSYAFFMSVRFSRTFSRVERLAGELGISNERLVRLARLKDTFLANATHELKTPLAGMVGIAESLLAGAGGTLPEAAQGHLRILSHSGKRLSRLVDDVLDYARLENMDVKLARQTVPLESTVRHVLALARSLAEAKGLELRHRLPADLPPVLADPGRLEQILFNLVGNAIKYTPRGFVELSAAVDGDEVAVRVADTGIGIAPKDQAAIFASFTQLSTRDSGPTGGAGLGLAIAKSLVELHGGTLRVASDTGRGSVFTFTLPRGRPEDAAAASRPGTPPNAAEAAEPALPALPPGPAGPHYDVLVVDDEPVNLHVMATCLAVADLSVKTARSGDEALALLAGDDDPDVVLLDVMLPGQDGYAVCRKIRRTRSAVSLPVVMLTCRNRVEDVVEGFAAGANDYVTKPFSREELVARVSTQRHLRRAHCVLEENVTLRSEVAMRRKTEQELRLRQIRLSRMLDAIGEAVFAVNQSDEIAFCNQTFATLTGRSAEETLGQPLARLFAAPDAPAARQLADGLDRMLHGGEAAATFDPVDIVTANGGSRACRVHATRFEVEEETLLLLHLGPDGASGEQHAAAFMDILRKVEGNRLRLQRIGVALQEMAAGDDHAGFLEDLGAIDALLENICHRLSGHWSEENVRLLAVHVMQAAVDCWDEVTGLGKGELAIQSGIWNAYMERDGYLRTQTLDKYLNLGTLPHRPRWRSIIATAEYVLSICPESFRNSGELRHLLAVLRQSGCGTPA